MPIPNNIYQCHRSFLFIQSQYKLKQAVTTWLRHTHNFNYYFYSDSMCDNFMKTMPERFYQAYLKCPLPVMKADLWRYCVIYENGGIYADADTLCLIDPRILITFLNNYELVFALEGNFGLPHLFCQWWFAAPKKSPLLLTLINNVVDKILSTDFYSITDEDFIHKITGPTIFTESIERYLYLNKIPIYKNKYHYLTKPNSVVKIFEPKIFHTKFIKHLGTGAGKNGWKNQKSLFLKINRDNKQKRKNSLPSSRQLLLTNGKI